MTRSAVVLGLGACNGGFSVAPVSATGTLSCDTDGEAELDAARAATERYADSAVAMNAGYLPEDRCDADASGAAMGIHYVRAAASFDQELDLLEPDVLLYVPEGDGVRLVGIEYLRPALLDGVVVFDAPEDPTAFDPAPLLFCQPFDGPMEGHAPGQPWHYDLHVWLFADNPDGLFAPYNPAESCDG